MDDIFVNFEKKWFSLRAFARHILLPWILVSLLAYFIASFGDGGQREINRLALVLFFSFYFLIVRTGLLFMTHNLHDQLKKDYAKKYAKQLVKQHDFGALGLKLGATLARIKVILSADAAEKHKDQMDAFR